MVTASIITSNLTAETLSSLRNPRIGFNFDFDLLRVLRASAVTAFQTMNRGDAEYAEKYKNRNQRVKTEFNSRPISFDLLRVLCASAVTAFKP